MHIVRTTKITRRIKTEAADCDFYPFNNFDSRID
jgi:hypothetical protein